MSTFVVVDAVVGVEQSYYHAIRNHKEERQRERLSVGNYCRSCTAFPFCSQLGCIARQGQAFLHVQLRPPLCDDRLQQVNRTESVITHTPVLLPEPAWPAWTEVVSSGRQVCCTNGRYHLQVNASPKRQQHVAMSHLVLSSCKPYQCPQQEYQSIMSA